MEGIDDDFGDIYSDVEVLATSAVNGAPESALLYVDEGGDDDSGDHKIGETCNSRGGDHESVCSIDGDSDGKDLALEAEGSESEDDLNIVLNEGDGGRVFPVKGGDARARSGGFVGASDDEDGDGGADDYVAGSEQVSAARNGERGCFATASYRSRFSQYKYTRPHVAAHSNIGKADRSAGMAVVPSTLARGDWERNRFHKSKGSVPGRVTFPSFASVSGAAQNRYGFSLPCYRTILDVNIDTFEHKPWRYPGIDITDFFNFGFDEESWKSYCNSMMLFQKKTLSRARSSIYGLKSSEEYIAGCQNEKVAQEAVDSETIQGDTGILPKGRAIQVERSTCERPSSMDVRRPCDRDSDVVIQITVQDSTDHSSGSQKIHDSPENEVVGVDDSTDNQCFTGENGDELSTESLYGNSGRLESSYVPNRCSQQQTASKRVIKDSLNNRNGQFSNVEREWHKKNVHTADGNTGVADPQTIIKEEVGRNTFNADPCSTESGFLVGDEKDYSPSSSHTGNQYESEQFENHKRRPSTTLVTDLKKSVTSDFDVPEDLKCSGFKLKEAHHKDSLKCKNSTQQKQRRHDRRLHNVGKRDTDKDAVLRKIDMEGHDRSFDGHRRQTSRLHNLGSDDRKDISNQRETESALHYCTNRIGDMHVQTACENEFYGKGHQNVRDKTDPYLRRKSDESNCFINERNTRVVKKRVERDPYHYENGSLVEDMGSHTCLESRHIISNYYAYSDKEKDHMSIRKDGLQLRRHGNDEWLLEVERRHPGDFIHQKDGRSVQFFDRERNFYDEQYEGHFLMNSRHDFSRRERYDSISSLDSDDYLHIQMEDKYQQRFNHHSVSSHSYKEPRRSHVSRCHGVGNSYDVYELRSIERYDHCRRQLSTERCRDKDWFDRQNDAYELEDTFSYTDDEAQLEERRYSWQSKELKWPRDELIFSHQDNNSYAKEAPFYLENISRKERPHYGDEFGDGWRVSSDKVNKHKLNMAKERSRSFKIDRRGRLEQAVLRCKDSVDLVVGEGKPTDRCTKGGSMMCNGEVEDMDNKNSRKATISNTSSRSHKKATELGITKMECNKNGDQWVDKFPVPDHKDDLDIEEGQIVREEQDKVVIFEKRHTSESASPRAVKEWKEDTEIPANASKVVEEVDQDRILEMLVKMERRRERFKESIPAKKELDRSSKMPQTDAEPVVETVENKPRPTRKRRWGGS